MPTPKNIYRDRINATISSIKKRIDEYQENLPLISSQFKEERETFHEALGKIILIVGTQSSGKTNLVTKLLDILPNLASINRKELMYHKCFPKIDELFFQDLLLEVSTILKGTINSQQFYELQCGDSCSASDKRYLEELQQAFRKIVDRTTFYRVVNNVIFVAYYDSMKPFLFKGQNVVLDDSILTSEEIYNQFKFCCGEYPDVFRVLLFADFETSIRNSIARNSKFASKLANYPLCKSVPQIIAELEILSGGSSDSYRLPKFIMEGYKLCYTFQSSVPAEDNILATYSKEGINATLFQMAREQLKLLGLLAYRNYPITEDYIDLPSELCNFFQDGICNVYSICKTKVDHIIDAKSVYHFSKAELSSYLSITLPWLDIKRGLDPTTQPIPWSENTLLHKELISSYTTSDIYSEVAPNINLAIIKESVNFKYLKDFISVIVEDLLTGKIVHIPFCRHKSGLVQFVAKFDKLQSINFTYYHPDQHPIEDDSSALALIPLFVFKVKKHGLNFNIVDLRRGGEIVELLTSDSLTTIFSKSNFALEWDIWSKCFGKVIIINGVSTSGKISFGGFISKFGYNLINFNDLIEDKVFDHSGSKLLAQGKQVLINDCDLSKIVWGYNVSKDYTEEQLVVIDKLKLSLDSYTFILASCYNKIYENARKFIFSGHNVVIDIVMTDETKISQLVSCFSNYLFKGGILYSSLQQNLNDCFGRNISVASENITQCSNNPTSIIAQYFDLYKLCKEDFKNTLCYIKPSDLILTLSQRQIISETETFLGRLDLIAMDQEEKDQYLKQSKELLESIIYSAIIASSTSKSLHIVPKLKNDFVLKCLGGSFKFLDEEDINLGEILGVCNEDCDGFVAS